MTDEFKKADRLISEYWREKYEKIRTEKQRLREALEKINKVKCTCEACIGHPMVTTCYNPYKDVAKQALAETEGN